MKRDSETEAKTGTSPFDDAVAVWHMADLSDSSGNNSVLTTQGDVRVGVELKGNDLEASLNRGGNGRAAEFRGGYLSAEQGANGKLNLSGNAMSMCIRLRDPSGTWDGPLFGKYGGDDQGSYHLYAIDGALKPFEGITREGRKVQTPYNDLFASEAGPKAIDGTKALIEFVWGAVPRQDIVEGLIEQKCGDPMLQEAKAK